MEAPMRVRSAALSACAALVVGVVLTISPQSALAGADCTFEVDPRDSQVRGFDITVTGSFAAHNNNEFRVYLGKDLNPLGGGWIELELPGITGITGLFDHTVTIPSDVDAGEYFLIVAAPLKSCRQEYTVLPFFVLQPPPGGFVFPTTTTTTLPVTTPTTTFTTTTVPETTTTEPIDEGEEITTTTEAVEETTTTLVEEEDDELLVAGEAIESGASAWMIGLLIAMAVALVGLLAFMLAQRSRE